MCSSLQGSSSHTHKIHMNLTDIHDSLTDQDKTLPCTKVKDKFSFETDLCYLCKLDAENGILLILRNVVIPLIRLKRKYLGQIPVL